MSASIIAGWPSHQRTASGSLGRLAVLGLCIAGLAAVDNLDFYRGADQDGVFAGTLTLPVQEAWSQKVASAVSGSMIVHDGVVYVGGDDGTVTALKLADGSRVWTFEATGAVGDAPAWVDGKIVFGTGFGSIYALDAATGAKLWETEAEGEIVGGVNIARPEGADPVITVGSHDNSVYGFALEDGKQLWAVATDDKVNSTPAVSGKYCMAGGCDSAVHVIDVTTGKRDRVYLFPEFLPTAITVHKGVIFAPYGNPSEAMVMAAHDMESDKVLWEFAAEAALKTTSAVTDDAIVFGSDDYLVYCLDRRTGEKRWAFETGDVIYSSPIIVDGKVVVGSDDGKLYILKLDTDKPEGEVLQSILVGPPVGGSPIFHQGRLLFGDSSGKVHCYVSAKP